MRITNRINNILGRTVGIQIKRSTSTKELSWHKLNPKKDISKLDLDKYLHELHIAFKKSVSVPGFIKTKGTPKPIHVSINKGNIRALRFELPTSDFLHFHSIVLLDSEGKEMGIDADTNIATSSRHRLDLIQSKEYSDLLFDPNGSHNQAFHTNYENKPWMTITFPKNIYIGGLIIKNRKGRSAIRIVGLEIAVMRDLEHWQTVYNFGGVDNYEKSAIEIAKRYKLDKFHKTIYKFTKFVAQGKDKQAKEQYLKMPIEYRSALRSAVNENILYSQNLEWNSHGVRRTFRFWTVEKKQRYISYSQQVINDLKDLSADVCFGFGSVLAVVRDKDLLPHDNDMDTIIAFKKTQASTLSAALDLVKSHLEKKGYRVEDRRFNFWHVKNDEFSVDVFVGIYDEDETIGWYPGPRGKLKRSDVFPTKSVSLLGIKCTIPKKPEDYLEVQYGKEWREPDPTHVHKWSDVKKPYYDIA